MDVPHLLAAMTTVLTLLGGLTRVWRFDRMRTVLDPATGDLTAGLGLVGALTSGRLLGDDDLVDQRDVGLHVEDLGGQLDGAVGSALRADDVDGRHVRLPSPRCGRGRRRHGGRGRRP